VYVLLGVVVIFNDGRAIRHGYRKAHTVNIMTPTDFIETALGLQVEKDDVFHTPSSHFTLNIIPVLAEFVHNP